MRIPRIPILSTWPFAGFCIAFVVFGALATRTFLADSLMSLYLGRYIFELGIPRVDTLTIEGAGRTWIDQQWLAQVAYYGAWEIGGNAAVGLLSAAANAAAFGLLCWLLVRRGVPGLQALAWTGLAVAVSLHNTFVRAQSFALPLFTIVLVLLLADAERERWSAWRWGAVLAVLVVWANVHGSLLLLLPFLAAYCAIRAVHAVRAGRSRDAAGYAGTALAAPATLLATPYGWSIVDYYRSVMANRTIGRYISEWHPADFASQESVPFVLLLFLTVGLVAFQWGRGVRPPLLPLALFLWFGLVGTQALRYQLWAAMPAVILASSVVRLPTDDSPDAARRAKRLLTAPAIVLVAAAIAVVAHHVMRPAEDYFSAVPMREVAAAARYLEAHPDATIIADDPSAPALIWLHPQLVVGRIAFDSRLEMYDQDELREFFRLITASDPDWLEAAEGYDLLLVSRLFHPGTVKHLEQLEGWRVLEQSDDGILVARE